MQLKSQSHSDFIFVAKGLTADFFNEERVVDDSLAFLCEQQGRDPEAELRKEPSVSDGNNGWNKLIRGKFVPS